MKRKLLGISEKLRNIDSELFSLFICAVILVARRVNSVKYSNLDILFMICAIFSWYKFRKDGYYNVLAWISCFMALLFFLMHWLELYRYTV